MNEYWHLSKQSFSDCRLETYFKIFNKLSTERISKENFFANLEPLEESLTKLSINFRNIEFNTFSYEFLKRNINANLVKNLGFNIQEMGPMDILEEISWIRQNISSDKYIVTDLVTNYLNKITLNISQVKMTNLSTAPIIEYDKNNDEFILGLKDGKTNKLITISIENYKKARTQEIYPYKPRNTICVVNLSNNIKINDREYIIKHLKNQFKMLLSKTIQNEFLNYLTEDENTIKCFCGNANLKDIIDLQKGILYISMSKGSTSGYFYEIADALKYNNLTSDNDIEKVRNIGRNFKRMARLLRYSNNVEEIFLDNEFKDAYNKFQNEKYVVLNEIIKKL